MTLRFRSASSSFDAADVLLLVAIGLGAFVFRWVTLDFGNDYFMHVSWAAAMLRGEWPVRDFVEPGFPLQTLISYLALREGGYQLAWDGFIACVLLSAGAVFTYATSRRLGLARWLAFIAAVVTTIAYPRLYAYPKTLVYPVAIYALAVYLRRPRRRVVVAMGAITAAAFLFRHDHGAWITGGSTLGLVLFHWGDRRTMVRAVATYGSTALLCAFPWIAWVMLSGHAEQYVAFLSARSLGFIRNARLPEQHFVIDREAPVLSLAPIDSPIVGIRWAPTAEADVRRDRELRFGLVPTPSAPDQYHLTNLASSNIGALIRDPAVEDTRGIDRGTLRAPSGAFTWLWLQTQRYFPLVRLRVFPGAIRGSNAVAWLTWVTFLVPVVALVTAIRLLSFLSAGRITVEGGRWSPVFVVVTAALSALTFQTLVRGSPDSRIGDIAPLTAILLSWLVWQSRRIGGWAGLVATPACILVLVLTLASAASYGRISARLAAASVDGPTNLVRRLLDVRTLYSTRPLDVYAPPGATGLARLARWLNDCTTAQDRVAIIGFEPELFVLSERGFAAGLAFYDQDWSDSAGDQSLAISRWSQQRVPVVVAMDSEWPSFSHNYPQIRAWIDERYSEVARSTFGGRKQVTVLVDRSRPSVRRHADTGLPCFDDPSSELVVGE